MAALDLKSDILYGHVSDSKKHQDILRFLKVLRRRYHRSERLYIVLDNFWPHKHERVRNWAAENNVEFVYTPNYKAYARTAQCNPHRGRLSRQSMSNHQDSQLHNVGDLPIYH
ncbi:transposase [Alicyclobacillus mali (ex Roth et al. 2021)]|uniref:transposase n=1 Tax=Alicyclobacillus mali (ex Roth et al. 2021) TaxID=1123961 RepID=UPI003D6D5D78